jgi:glycosyltransferase involved in cell wall biosynthesis
MNNRAVTLVIANIEWNFVWQRHLTLASLFARDSDVVFCEIPGIRRVGWRDGSRLIVRAWRLLRGHRIATSGEPVPARLRIIRPWVLPATNRFFCALNARLLVRFLRHEPELRHGVRLVMNYSPTRTALQLIDLVPHQRLIYDCTNDWLSVRGVPSSLAADEQRLLARADLTLVSGEELYARKSDLARRLAIVPEGVLLERFTGIPLPPLEGPVTLLYYGHIHRQHLDLEMLDKLARLKPNWRLILVGPVKTPHRFPANVELRGQLPHASLRTAIEPAHVLLLPYALNEYTRCVFPAKTYECLATGRPVVATPLPALVKSVGDHLRFAQGAEEVAAAAETALAEDTAELASARVAVARANDWESRYRQILTLLDRVEGRPLDDQH